jgi:hypothetical protein
MSCVRTTFPSLAPSLRATASRCFARARYIRGSVVPTAPVDRVVGHFSVSILRQCAVSSLLGRRAGRGLGRAASPPRKIQSA